jgi:hypothetical protein
MQLWQIKALELERLALEQLDKFTREHALFFLIGIIYLLLALLAWVLSGALRSKDEKFRSYMRPAIIIHLPGTPPPPADTAFDPFPSLRDPPDCDCEDQHWD